MSKAKWICNFFAYAWHMSRSPQPSFLLKLTNSECHLSSLPTRNKYWAIFRLSICKAKILNGCKSCSGVIVGHLPPYVLEPFLSWRRHAIHALIRLTFREFCDAAAIFHSKRKCFFKGEILLFEAAQLAGQLNRLPFSLPFCVFLPD